ncbi:MULTISPECIES: DUF305 domain-containing protein [unclassified Ruminococcus]|uniref:DUF305 domain-containing protein n=1 Tax=unclassified Ruminococcus TaxID=2608920 RepID=UPI00210D58CA|nr:MULTISPECIES: DUF305 domain-containing protein [unclassified Ruminococcus]MCQ4022111.1 DUF305 domain-containing protein [Ruminococcus sp. zg-924]MCQ4114431.1 DUF305 domain-containing protein [Ruminococcus sp. zg-921]
MNYSQQSNKDIKRYLCNYYEILDDMIIGMNCAKLTDSISHNFIMQMIPHHRAAIEMSENLLMYTNFVPLQRIAQNIVKEQTKSIENMERALMNCEIVINTQLDLCRYKKCYDRITRMMFSQMRNACSDNNINADFMREMIPHHQGAIRMSKNALRYPICSELNPILQAIIKSQEKGVQEMESLLKKLGC